MAFRSTSALAAERYVPSQNPRCLRTGSAADCRLGYGMVCAGAGFANAVDPVERCVAGLTVSAARPASVVCHGQTFFERLRRIVWSVSWRPATTVRSARARGLRLLGQSFLLI